jgi:hypothetical protein
VEDQPIPLQQAAVTAVVGPLPKEFDMHGKNAIITDASRGLGRSMATNLARDGVGVLGT